MKQNALYMASGFLWACVAGAILQFLPIGWIPMLGLMAAAVVAQVLASNQPWKLKFNPLGLIFLTIASLLLVAAILLRR